MLYQASRESVPQGKKMRFPSQDRRSIFAAMTKLLEKALEAVQRLPDDVQDEIARAMLTLAGNGEGLEAVDPAHIPSVIESLGQARRREFATDAEIETAFRRFDA